MIQTYTFNLRKVRIKLFISYTISVKIIISQIKQLLVNMNVDHNDVLYLFTDPVVKHVPYPVIRPVQVIKHVPVDRPCKYCLHKS